MGALHTCLQGTNLVAQGHACAAVASSPAVAYGLAVAGTALLAAWLARHL